MNKRLCFQIGLAFLLVSISQTKTSGKEEDLKARGQTLMEAKGCLNCHYVQGDGGFIAPPLNGISKYRSEAEILKMLTGPRPAKKVSESYPSPEELMSHVRLDEADAKVVAAYLIALPEDESFETKGHGKEWKDIFPQGSQFKPHKVSSSSRQGRKLFYKKGCIACHTVEGRGGRVGPSLNGIGATRSKAFIEQRINSGAVVMKSGAAYQPSSYSMPPSSLPKRDVKRLSEYLLTLPALPTE